MNPPLFRPEPGAVALVTGAGKRIGRVIAIALAQAGWRVAVHYGRSHDEARRTVADIEAAGGTAHAFSCDLADEAAVARLAGEVAAHFGRLDAVVNNASLFEYDDAASFSGDMLRAHLGPNLVAPIVLARDLAAQLRARGEEARGVVVNLLDQKLWNYNPDFLSYSLTKAAMEAANTMLAQALAPTVRVVGVAPGLTLPSHLQSEEDFARTHQLSPLGKASDPRAVADAVLFAAGNPSITGTTILVDGGQHLVGFARDFSLMKG
ncbi:SDR family oxidoreductase [Verticiella sediminum]|uniref:SDR family oxidoreductase n=1 Tax=Verticiella sediminum TaxID=1247510 RepID=A0A556AG76_9BURK|nr:SDR family oxidoreductase [Verticiella sediminum]TSH91898.1 SDR family oxidoreductase [Verticiella sediminum]